MMERQGLVRRRVGSGTFLTDDADHVFEKMDQTSVAAHDNGAELRRDRRGPAPVRAGDDASRRQPRRASGTRRDARDAPDDPQRRRPGASSRSSIYALHQQMFAATKNRFLIQIMDSIVADRRAVRLRRPRHRQARAAPVRQQTHKELAAIVEAIAERQGEAGRGADVRSPHADARDDQYLAVRKSSLTGT